MLIQLSIRNVVLIEKLDLTFDQGLTVFTGETGAGKSILLDSLALTLGERASSSLIRTGSNQASVTACFEIEKTHPVYQQLQLQGYEIPEITDQPLVIRRTISQDGRSRAYVNDQLISLNFLREIGQLLIEIQGQHAQIGLMDMRNHLSLLDNFGTPLNLLNETRKTYYQWTETTVKLAALKKNLEKTLHEEKWLRESVEELKNLSPQAEEEQELVHKRRSLQQNERHLELLVSALNQLAPQDRKNNQPSQVLLNASKTLQRLLSNSENTSFSESNKSIQAVLEAITQAEESLAEAETTLSQLVNTIEIDPQQIDEIEERLFSLRGASRKYGVTIDELSHLLQEFEIKLNQLDIGTTQIKTLEIEVNQHRQKFEKAAEALSQHRQKIAKKLEQAVTAELKPLKLERAKFLVSLKPLNRDAWNQNGKEQIEFLIAANPGVPPAPLNKAASGGELSRLLLALKVVLSQKSTLSALIFDEIDSGVGGATASAIGEKLHHVAQTMQVFAVTHSPQVAASGDTQFQISKLIKNGVTYTTTKCLNSNERKEEIARMLAGNQITDAARSAADSLLNK